MENRFSTVVGRLQATGTAGDTATTAESRANVLRRVVEQFDEKDKFGIYAAGRTGRHPGDQQRHHEP